MGIDGEQHTGILHAIGIATPTHHHHTHAHTHHSSYLKGGPKPADKSTVVVLVGTPTVSMQDM